MIGLLMSLGGCLVNLIYERYPMYKTQADAVKEWLQAYKANEEHIDRQLDKLRTLRARMMTVSSQKLSDMPKSGNVNKDQLADYMIRLERLEVSVQNFIDIQEQGKKTIQDLVGGLKNADERKVIVYRYLYGYEWNDVMDVLYRDDPKFAQSMEAYRRRMYRAHESALANMAKEWNSHG